MNTNDKIQEVQLEIVEAKQQVEMVIINVIERGDKLEDLEEKSNQLVSSAGMFKKQAKKVERKMWWQNFKMKLFLFVIFLIIVGVIASLLSIYIPKHN